MRTIFFILALMLPSAVAAQHSNVPAFEFGGETYTPATYDALKSHEGFFGSDLSAYRNRRVVFIGTLLDCNILKYSEDADHDAYKSHRSLTEIGLRPPEGSIYKSISVVILKSVTSRDISQEVSDCRQYEREHGEFNLREPQFVVWGKYVQGKRAGSSSFSLGRVEMHGIDFVAGKGGSAITPTPETAIKMGNALYRYLTE